jgi:hypothetical protein
MNRARGWGFVLLVATVAIPGVAVAGGFSVNVWTDRGDDAVYEPGDRVAIRARSSDDANLLVYDIDAEGYVHVLFPYRGRNGYVEGRQTFIIPDAGSSEELVVRGPVGEGYIVAIASRSPFMDLPSFLRPYDPRAEGVGYVGGAESVDGDDDFVTREGRIVGDPFVAIERIRRRVLSHPDDRDDFATAHVSYYVHDRVRYPRYVCYDCHRPGRWAWWDGFDPYYASCSVVDFRVNYGWAWGTPYWSGFVPYYVYVVRPTCPPYYRPWVGTCYSSWDGWGRWNRLWGSHLVRYKPSAPPTTYIPPSKYKWDRRWQDSRPAPPGFITAADAGGRGRAQRMPASGDPDARVITRTDWRPGGESRRPATRAPMGDAPRDEGSSGNVVERSGRGVERSPAGGAGRDDNPSSVDRGQGRPSSEPPRGRIEPSPNGRREGRPGGSDAPPRPESSQGERPRYDRPSGPRSDQPRVERPEPSQGERPRYDRPSGPRSDQPRVERPAPRSDRPRVERPAPPRSDQPRVERPAPPRSDQPRVHRHEPARTDTPRKERPAAPSRDDRKERGRRGGGQ